MTTLTLKSHSKTKRDVTGAVKQNRSAGRYDYLIVGAGFAGCVLAERLASQLDRRVLLIDRRDHVSGNAYDCLNAEGVMIHRYGPHIFHTNAQRVIDYLSRFTDWRPYEHRVLASVDGQQVPIPINLTTINALYGLKLDSAQAAEFLAARATPGLTITSSRDVVISQIGLELYEKFFEGYTGKQWGIDASQLDKSVTSRDVLHTRITEYKHLTGQVHPKTSSTYEFPTDTGDPYYSIPTPENAALYRRYEELAERTPGITFTGRLGTYRYYNMDQVVAQSLTLFSTIAQKMEADSTAARSPAPSALAVA